MNVKNEIIRTENWKWISFSMLYCYNN